MELLVTGLDNKNNLVIGEKGHISLDWSSKLFDLILQIDFQSVRETNYKLQEYNEKINNIYYQIKENKNVMALKMMYKLISYVRDILYGKGEYNLSYYQLLYFYENMKTINNEMGEKLTKKMIECFVNMGDEHSLGCWKDLKNISEIVFSKTFEKGNFITDTIVDIYINQIYKDEEDMRSKKNISLMSRWFPRENSKNKLMFKEVAKKLYKKETKNNYTTIKKEKEEKEEKMKKFIYMSLRKRIAKLNKYLDTVQIKMCNKEWKNINFDNVTSLTIQKQKKSFLNLKKDSSERYNDEDRKECKNNFELFINNNDTIKGKRCSLYNFVKDTMDTYNKREWDVINKQWDSYIEQFNNFTNMIPLVDTSQSMSDDKCIPLYNAIGLGIAISQKNDNIFKDRIMTFSANPNWITLDKQKTFTEKVRKISNNSDWGYNTNFYSALKLILDVILEKEIPPDNVENMILVILSDMQIDVADEGHITNQQRTLFENIEKEYETTGLKSKYKKPYKAPHILFWNLRKTNNFPVKSETKNTTMVSGYNLGVLNKFCENGIESLKEINPLVNLKEALNNKRYDSISNYFDDMVEKYNNNLF